MTCRYLGYTRDSDRIGVPHLHGRVATLRRAVAKLAVSVVAHSPQCPVCPFDEHCVGISRADRSNTGYRESSNVSSLRGRGPAYRSAVTNLTIPVVAHPPEGPV